MMQFLTRDIKHRLGCGPGKADVQKHPFFTGIDWVKLANLEVPPPFKPTIKANFDPEARGRHAPFSTSQFTSEKAVLTPVDPKLIAT